MIIIAQLYIANNSVNTNVTTEVVNAINNHIAVIYK